jgi:hypothetical protein
LYELLSIGAKPTMPEFKLIAKACVNFDAWCIEDLTQSFTEASVLVDTCSIKGKALKWVMSF